MVTEVREKKNDKSIANQVPHGGHLLHGDRQHITSRGTRGRDVSKKKKGACVHL